MKWIKCSKRLPRGYGYVLATDGEEIAIYLKSLVRSYSKDKIAPLTHWMALPSLPHAAGDKGVKDG